jgi:hypothetical protein
VDRSNLQESELAASSTGRRRQAKTYSGDTVKCFCGKEDCESPNGTTIDDSTKCWGAHGDKCFRLLSKRCNISYCSECSYIRSLKK